MTFWQIWPRQSSRQLSSSTSERSGGLRSLLRLAGQAVIGRLGDIATKLPDEVIKERLTALITRRSCGSSPTRPDV